MARPLRIEFPGAVYHVTSRGDRREPIYVDDADREAFLEILALAMGRFDAEVLAYCLMGNHYHLVLHTRAANLSHVMRHINGVYSQAYNRRHGIVGHLFQGRFKAILVDRDAYLLALCRYVERNPAAAGLVPEASQWPWSSYRAHAGLAETPSWLDTDGLHGYLLGHAPATGRDRARAAALYARLVEDTADADANLWQRALSGQIFLGDDAFAERMRAQAAQPRLRSPEVPKIQRNARSSSTLAECLRQHSNRGAALSHAYRVLGLSMTNMARELGLSVSRVSRLVSAWEQAAADAAKGKT